MSQQVQQFLAKVAAQNREALRELAQVRAEYAAVRESLDKRPQSVEDQINAFKGRRITYSLVGSQTFTSSDDGNRGQPISMLVSQDGPFIQTHYPLAIWKVSSPAAATNFGKWRPVSTWPLDDQVLDGDTIDISYEMTTGGSQRNFQNSPVPPLLSRPDQFEPLPQWTIYNPNESIQFIPTYENIDFSSGGTATEGGTLVVVLPGFRVVNM